MQDGPTAWGHGGLATTTPAAFLTKMVVAGAGFDVAYLGAFRGMTALSTPDQRAGLLAAFLIVSCVAFGVPAVIAGVATTTIGLHSTALVYATSLVILVGAAAAILLTRPGDEPTEAALVSPGAMPPGPCTAPPCPEALGPADGEPRVRLPDEVAGTLARARPVGKEEFR
jgi:hypothetical protein